MEFRQQVDPVGDADRAGALQGDGVPVAGVEHGGQGVGAGFPHGVEGLAVGTRELAGLGGDRGAHVGGDAERMVQHGQAGDHR